MSTTLHFGISKCQVARLHKLLHLETLLSEKAQIINESVCFDFFLSGSEICTLKRNRELEIELGPDLTPDDLASSYLGFWTRLTSLQIVLLFLQCQISIGVFQIYMIRKVVLVTLWKWYGCENVSCIRLISSPNPVRNYHTHPLKYREGLIFLRGYKRSPSGGLSSSGVGGLCGSHLCVLWSY